MKKVLVICLVFIMTFSLAACSTNDNSTVIKPDSVSTENTTVAETTAEITSEITEITTEAVTTTEVEATTETEVTTETETTTEIHVHSYSESDKQEATCTENGYITFVCECGDSYTEDVPALGHDFTDYIYNNDASYDGDGTETATCKLCGVTDSRVKAGTKLEKPPVPEYVAPDGSIVTLENSCPWDGKWHYWHWVPMGGAKGIAYLSKYSDECYVYDFPNGNILEVVTDRDRIFNITFNRWTVSHDDYCGSLYDYMEIYYNGGIAYLEGFHIMIE